MFLIGSFAHMSGVTRKALRHYDRLGLFRPAWTDPATGYRWYSPTQLPELRRIVALRDLGIPLAEIAGLREGNADLREALVRRRAELEVHQRAVERKLATLDIRVDMADDGPDVVVRTIQAELVATIGARVPPGGDLGPMFHELEATVRDAGVRADRPPGTLIAEGEGARDVEVFVPVRRALEEGRVSSRRLPGGRFAAVIHQGSYQELPSLVEGLRRWVMGAGFEQQGPMRIIYLRFGAEPELELPEAYLVAHHADFLTEVQIPVG